MGNIIIGNFRYNVNGGYPLNIEIENKCGDIIRFNSDDLPYFLYVVDSIRRNVRKGLNKGDWDDLQLI